MRISLLFTTLFSIQLLAGKPTAEFKQKANLTSVKKANISATEYSDDLTRIGEILLEEPKNYLLAHKMFQQALEINPEQEKALFYISFTEIVLNFRGIEKQAAHHLSEEQIKYYREEAFKTKYPELIKLVTELPENIVEMKRLEDVQKFVELNLIPSFELAIKNMGRIKNEIKLIWPQSDKIITTYSSKCYNYGTEEYPYWYCYDKERTRIKKAEGASEQKVGEADLIIIKNGLSAMMDYLKIWTAYNFEGLGNISETAKLMEKQFGRALTEKEKIGLLNKNKTILTLRKDNQLKSVSESLKKTITNLLDLATMRDLLCNKPKRMDYLIPDLCMSLNEEMDLNTYLELMSGTTEYTMGYNSKGEKVKIMVNLPALFNNPVNDLKTLFPTKFDWNGNGKWNYNQSLNGVFPNADYGHKLKELNY